MSAVASTLPNNGKLRHDVRWSYRFSMCVLVLFVLFNAYLFYALYLDGTVVNRPVVYWEGSFVPQSNYYHAGEEIWLRIVVTKHTDLAGTITWSLVSDAGHVIHFQPRRPSISQGFHNVIVPVVRIPINTPPGKYHLEGVAAYEISQLRTVSIPMRSTCFWIEPPREDNTPTQIYEGGRNETQ